ncbi:MAG: sigma-70 family RNA polymerase sigma factor [Phycisphaerales bacterium JB043]
MDVSETRVTLLTRLRDESDPAAWAEFYQRYQELIALFAGRWGLQQADCDDVIQETLAKLVRSMPSFEYDRTKGRFRAYLKTVVSSVVLTKLRQKAKRPDVQHLDHVPEPSSENIDLMWESEWRRHHVRLAMRRIRNEYNSTDCLAFDRYALNGEDPKAVAESLSMSIDRVYQAKSRIMQRMRSLIDAQISEEEL